MSLYAKVVVLLCGLFAAYGAVDYAVQREVILPSFESLEADLARTDMERVTRAIDGELAQLQTFCADWGNWLDTYQYMAGRNAGFIEENMTPSTIVAAGLDVVAFVDKEGRFVWRKGLQPATGNDLPYAFLAADALDPAHPFMKAIRDGKAAKGIMQTEHGPAMVVTAPVLDGAGKGPHRGAVLLARVITPAVAARLAEQAQVKLEIAAQPPATLSNGDGAPRNATRIVPGESTNSVFRNLEDIYGRPSVLLHIDLPREVTARGRDAIGYALLSVCLAGLVVMLALLTALRWMVLLPVSRLTRHAVAIAEGDDLTRRMNLRRADEIGLLAREFDRMVDRLSDARGRVVDQSFEAGAAQVASGVLHNVGNAMTPLGVTVSALQERLRRAPLGEIEMVLAELEAGVDEPERRGDLEQFLKLAVRELLRVASMAGDDADMLARQAESIQAALAQQLRTSRAGPVVESVELLSLIQRGIEMVPPGLRRMLMIEFDDSVRAAGTLPLPRITLLQVVQNLVQNAAEAVRDSGQERGRLRVSCRGARAAGDIELLTIAFADDGVGIPEQDLTRVFENGYSTKPPTSNQGIGLHWCANALNEFGGSIRAVERRGGGATFEVVIPLRRSAASTAARAA